MTTYGRAAWGAPTPAGGAQLVGPLQGIAIHHTAARIPTSPEAALREVRTIYLEHTSPSSSDPTKPWSDIGYSWLVDAWGNIYEGRGWLRSGAHTPGYNSKVHAIAYIGWGREPIPAAALAAMAQCVTDGQRAGAVVMRPTFMGHRDALSTECPGDALYAQIAELEAIVNDGDLGPATTPPTTAEEDDMTPEQATQLQQLHFWIGQGYVAGGTVAAMRPDMDAIGRRLDAIETRLGALEAGEVPTADEVVLAAARRITEAAR